MFTIEALKARHGDCLLLRWGTPNNLRTALIDGGPDGTYSGSLRPRLSQLAGYKNTLALDLVMVSHIDDDHIGGLLDFAEEIEAETAPASIRKLWFNSLEKLLDGPIIPKETNTAIAAVNGAFTPRNQCQDIWQNKVIASVPQGQALNGFAKRSGLALTLNAPYKPLVIQGLAPQTAVIEGLSLTPVAPSLKAVEALRKVWKEKRKDTVEAAYKDDSPYNLSSIVVVAEFDGKRMLLTGDALGRDVIDGLDAAGLLDANGRAHFDLMKLPHHGSQNNVTLDFYQRLTADHYVVSGDNMRFPNPHPNAMKWLEEARGQADYKVYCPYELEGLRERFGSRLVTTPVNEYGVTVNLSPA